jgi:hypothetical protein
VAALPPIPLWALRAGGIGVAAFIILFLTLIRDQSVALRRFRERTPPPGNWSTWADTKCTSAAPAVGHQQ